MKIKHINIFFVLLLSTVFTNIGYSQSHNKLSAYGSLFVKSNKVLGDYQPMIGGMGAIVFNEKIAVGAYGNGMVGSIDFKGSDLTNEGSNDLFLKMGYGGIFAEYFIISNQRLRLSVPVKLGYGAAGVYDDETYKRIEKSRLLVLEPELNLDFRIGPNFAISAQAGYRLADVKELYNINDNHISGWNFGVGIKTIAY